MSKNTNQKNHVWVLEVKLDGEWQGIGAGITRQDTRNAQRANFAPKQSRIRKYVPAQ